MLQYDFEESVGYWLTVTTQAYHRAFNDALAPHGITFRQSQVLGWLALEGETTQAELAGKMLIEPATLVSILDRMERARLIVRRSCATDRRRKWVSVAPDAEPVWQRIVECANRIRQRATAGLSDRQQAVLKRALRRVHENLRSRSPLELADE